MTTELNQFEETIEKTKDQVVETAKRAATELDRQSKRLRKEIDEAGTRAKRTGADLQKNVEEFADTTLNRARDEFKKQARNLEKVLTSARKDVDRFWADIEVVMDDLISARNHLAHALRIDKALASIQRELKRKPHEDRCAAMPEPINPQPTTPTFEVGQKAVLSYISPNAIVRDIVDREPEVIRASASFTTVMELIGNGTIVAIAALVIIGLVVGHDGAAGLRRREPFVPCPESSLRRFFWLISRWL